MPRPVKCRRICRFPQETIFYPSENADGEVITLTFDEYECIRLIDKCGFSQEQCAQFMQVARTTVQKIYDDARKKIACMIVDGLPLKIGGGEYRLCGGDNSACFMSDCFKREIPEKYNLVKGDNIMRIAVTYQNGEIFQHFGHSEQIKIYDTQDGKIVDSKVVDTSATGHGALVEVLSAAKVDVLICGGIGGGAQSALAQAGIKLYGGVSGNADEMVNAFLQNNLQYNPNVHCDHHDHHGDHSCGGHGEGHHCGEDKHGCKGNH
ncbi:MAG: DUF134 domain-containing protein [Clostridia bacterium]|nr:DUF134 domain-containing protein [Clostridia bacterium]